MSKTGFETMEGKIIVVLTGFGLIVGKWEEGILTNPRQLSFEQQEKTLKVNFGKMIGNPSMFEIGSSAYYESEAAELNELYLEAIKPQSLIQVV